jgi:hypothetical protein
MKRHVYQRGGIFPPSSQKCQVDRYGQLRPEYAKKTACVTDLDWSDGHAAHPAACKMPNHKSLQCFPAAGRSHLLPIFLRFGTKPLKSWIDGHEQNGVSAPNELSGD